MTSSTTSSMRVSSRVGPKFEGSADRAAREGRAAGTPGIPFGAIRFVLSILQPCNVVSLRVIPACVAAMSGSGRGPAREARIAVS